MGNPRGRPKREAEAEPDDLDAAAAEADRLASLTGSEALRAELAHVARLTAMATRDRSYVAAEKFLRSERELRASIRDLRAREESEMLDSDEALLAELRGALVALPESMLVDVLSSMRLSVLEYAAKLAGTTTAPPLTH